MKLRNLVLASSILVAAGLVLAAYGHKSAGYHSPEITKGEHKVDDAQLIRARANWFYRQRAYPLKHIPAFARERAWDSFRQGQRSQRQYLQQKYGANYSRLSAAAALAAGVVNTGANWVSIGPKPTNDFFFQPSVSGRVTALVVDPCDATGNTVFLGGAQGGLWLTTNGGGNWAPLTDQAPSLAIGSLAVPPSTPGSAGCVGTVSKTVYVGTGEQNFAIDSYYGAGVLTCTTTTGTSYTCTPDNTLGAFNTSNPLTQDTGGPFIGGLAVDPQNPQILLAAVQGFSSTLQSGIWCSADGGSNWNHVLPNTTRVVGTAVAFDQAGFAYAALGNIDGGKSVGATSLNGVYRSQSAFTSNCSPTFTQLGGLTSLASPSTMGRVEMSVYSTSTSSSSSDIIFAAIARAADISSTLLGVFKSTDGGTNWTPLSDPLVNNANGFCNNQCFYDITIQIDPHNSNVVYAGGAAPGNGATIIASTDGGSSWTDISNNSCNNCFSGVHVDAHAIAFAPPGTAPAATKVYIGTDGGAWSNTTPEAPTSTQTWSNLNQTLALTQFYSGLSNNPAGWQYRSFGGAQDNGTQVFGQSNSLAWDNTLSCGDGGVTLVDPSTPSTVYGECAYIPGFLLGVEKSLFNGSADDVNGNTTFFETSYGINANDDGSFIPPMAIDPTNPQNVYFGTYRIWQSADGAGSWSAISPDVTGSASVSACAQNPEACVLTGIAVAPTDSKEVVTGSSIGFVYLSQNADQGANSTWTDVTGSGLPARSITHVAVDPNDANSIYATFSGFSGFNGDNAGHVFLGTVTPGTTPSVVWTDVSFGTACVAPAGDLPNIPVNDIVVDPNEPGQLFVATDVGVYMGTLQGTAPVTGGCWQPLGNGLPNSAVLSLTLNDASRTLIAGTHGRSAWALALGDQPAFSLGSLSPASVDAGASQSTLLLNGSGFTAGSSVNWTPKGGSATSLTQGTAPAGCSVPTCIAVQVSSGLLSTGNVVSVSVSDSTKTPSTTNSLPFTITSSTPTLTNVTPTSSTAPAASNLSLSLTGTNFISGTVPGLAQLSAFPSNCFSTSNVTSTSLTATVQSSCLQYGGIFFVTATNPPPGGGSTNPNLFAYDPNTGNPICCLLKVTGPAPSNDSFNSATGVSSSSFSTTEDTSGATTASSDPQIPSSCTTGAANSGAANSVWFKYTPSSGVTAELDTVGSSYDTILSAWQLQSSTANAAPSPAAPFSRPPLYLIVAFLLTALLLVYAIRWKRPVSRRFATVLALALLTGSLVFQAACGGGGSSGGGTTPPPTTTTLTNVACNDDVVLGIDRVSQISGLSLNANTTYYFMVSSYGLPTGPSTIVGDGGKLVFNLNAK